MKFDFVNDDKKNDPDFAEVPGSTAVSPLKLFDLNQARDSLDHYREKIDDLSAQAAAFEITSDADLTTVSEMGLQAKHLKVNIIEAAELHYKPYYNHYKSIKGMENTITGVLDTIIETSEKKISQYGYQKEMDRRREQEQARKKQAALQKKLNKQALKNKVKAPVIQEKIVTPPDTKTKTDLGTANIKMVWTGEIEDYESLYLFDWVLRNNFDAYKKVADQTVKRLLKAGIHEGIKGVKFFEIAQGKLRKG